MKFFETEDFRKQQKEWYQKLQDAGFKDIETTVGTEQKLRQYSRQFTDTEKLAYYQALTYNFYTESFDNKTDELVLYLRADGLKIKEISVILKENGLTGWHRESIRYTVRKYEMRWGIRSYKPNQLSFKRGQNG